MEAPEAKEARKVDSHLTSPAAFVEGGIQEACDDACSICLEEFTENDPAAVTNCKHEFHLQCILEWCQRSSQCPMCWQAISLKDPTSQELLEAVEHERSIRMNPARNAAIFHHPALGDFELQHLPVGANDAELEERIIQHLAAAAAMRRARHSSRREGHRSHRSHSSAQSHPQFLVFSSHPSSGSSLPSQIGEADEPGSLAVGSSSIPYASERDEVPQQMPQLSFVQTEQNSASAAGQVPVHANQQGFSANNGTTGGQSMSPNQDRAGPSDLQSFSESLKSRLNAVSMRYKESLSKSTRGWKERLFSRGPSVAELGSEVRREVNAGIASVSRMMERLETRENNRASHDTLHNNSPDGSVTEQTNRNDTESHGEGPLIGNETPASCAASSGSN